MTLTIRLMGTPSIHRLGQPSYRFRSRKSWALLAYLLSTSHAPSRSELASLLYADADDPLRALRWNLAELRRGLGPEAAISGDPVVLSLPDDAVVDVEVLTRGSSRDALRLPGLDRELLDGISVKGAPAFESWLLGERRYVATATESIIHEAALDALSRSDLKSALGFGLRLISANPLEENHQALVIRLYRMLGDHEAAQRQFEAFRDHLHAELGVEPGLSVQAAHRQPIQRGIGLGDEASIDAAVEAGSAAIRAGAVEAGVASLRRAVSAADLHGFDLLRMASRLVLAEALIHSWRGMDEEGVAALHAVVAIGTDLGAGDAVAHAYSELGYVDFLRARYDRAERFLAAATQDSVRSAMASTYLGAVASDRARYPEAIAFLHQAIDGSRAGHDARSEAAAHTMLGRVHVLRGDLDLASDSIERGYGLAEREGWLAYLPFPQTLRGEVAIARGDLAEGVDSLDQAFARACHLGDPCWEAYAARGRALAASSNGDTDLAFDILSDARTRCNRLADPYVWLDAYILDAQCHLGRSVGHPNTADWVETLRDLTLRTGMRELAVRALVHGEGIGRETDGDAARLRSIEIDNPALHAIVAAM